MGTKPLELTKEEAVSLSMAYRNQVNNFKLRFSNCGSKNIEAEGQAYFRELELLQAKLEKFITGFE